MSTNPHLFPNCAGVILAGGQSSRFGSNKALALYRNQPLVARVAAALEQLFAQRLLVTNTPQTFAFLNWPMTGDLHPGAGPLAGIEAAFHHLTAPRIFVAACDMPLLDPAVIARLINCPGDWDVVLPALSEGREPLHAVYHRRILPKVNAALEQGRLRLADLLQELRVKEMSGSELGLGAGKTNSFVNINYQRDLAALNQPALSLAAAQRLLLATVAPGPGEKVDLLKVLDRVPQAAVKARLAVPSFPQSCRDGYALRAADCAEGQREITLSIRGEIAAGGTPPAAPLQTGETFRIMTGGLVPAGADCVIPFEEVGHQGKRTIRLRKHCRPGDYIRPTGSELSRGQIIVGGGRPVTPGHLPLLATAGIDAVMVFCRPRVGLLCTGNELLADPGGDPPPGSLIGGNRFLLASLVQRHGGEPVDLGTVGDETAALTAALQRARQQDLQFIITTGGMGPGKYDLVGGALRKLGARLLYQELKLRPGKATLAACLDDRLLFGLPGPPPAVHLLFLALIAPVLRRAAGLCPAGRKPLLARLTRPFKFRPGPATQLKEGILSSADGHLLIRPPRPAESFNGVVVIPPRRCSLVAGDLVKVLPTTPDTAALAG